ncbi:MAG: response regulator [Undibacterium sp.]|nr:response regulator [Undibacterium sp.]
MSLSSVNKSHRSLSVLVADDDEFIQHATVIMLKNLGHSGAMVDDGAKALACLAQRRFDVVLLDVMMPVMDGLEVLAAIRRQERGTDQHQRIIMATGHAEPNDMARLSQAGADGYVAKPIDIERLQAELCRVAALK